MVLAISSTEAIRRSTARTASTSFTAPVTERILFASCRPLVTSWIALVSGCGLPFDPGGVGS